MKSLTTLALALAAVHWQLPEATTFVAAQSSSTRAALVPPPLPSPKPPVEYTLTLQRDASAVKGLSIPRVGGSFWGFSIEMSAVNDIIGKNSTSLNVPFLNLLANLQARAGGVLVRIGGFSQDTAAMVDDVHDADGFNTALATTNQTQSGLAPAPPLLYTKDIFYMAANISSSLNVKWFFGIPFNQTSWRLAIAEAAESILGDQLMGLQAGVEPDLYDRFGLRPVGYSPASYTKEVANLLEAIDANPNIPVKNNLVGPNIATGGWTPEQVWDTGFVEQFKDRLRALSVQKYPANNCAAQFSTGNPVNPHTILPSFLNHKGPVDLVTPYHGTQAVAQGAKLPLMMLETNTASCGGFPGISDAYAAALWAVDYGFQLAQSNFTHGLLSVNGQGTPSNPFSPPPVNQSASEWSVAPIYYSALVLAEAFGKTNTSRIVDITTNTFTPAYAIYEKDILSKVALINYMDDATGATDLKVNLTLPSGIPGVVKVKYLKAKSVSSLEGVSWAGQTFGDSLQSDGRLKGDLDVQTITCDIVAKSCVVPVPAPGLALVFLDTATPEIDIGQATQTFATTVGANPTTGSPSGKPTSGGFSIVGSYSHVVFIATLAMILLA